MAMSKRKKPSQLKTTTVNEDIISNLPESLLLHIISFLPTTCAVSTSILSKTWENLWMSTTKLQFSLVCKEQVSKFAFFVDNVLRCHSSNITSSYLYESPLCYLNPSIVQSWISAAVNRQVQEVHLIIRSWSVIPLPLSLCNSNMLTVLKIESHGCLELPSNIFFSSLKVLHLKDVNFLDDVSFGRFFSGLSYIEELKLSYSHWIYVKNGTISLPTLRRLYLSFCGYGSGARKDYFIKLNAENLIYLDCRSGLSVDLSLDNVPSLDKANICIIRGQKPWEIESCRAINLLAGFCYARSLKIAGGSLSDLRRLKSEENLNFFPTFINLTTLEIYSRLTSNAAVSFIDILHRAPILESVVIQEVYGGKWSRKPYPQCIERSLRNCSILLFRGRQADIRFVKFVLKAAKVLERLQLCCTRSLCRQQMKLNGVMNKLKNLPTASNCCEIELVTT